MKNKSKCNKVDSNFFSKFLNSSLVIEIFVVDFSNYSAKCTLILFSFVLLSCKRLINFVFECA